MLYAFPYQTKAMPRRARLSLPGVPLHLIQRGNNRQACFYSPDDCRFYLDWLEDHARRQGCRIHAFVLMTNHVHLLMTADEAEAPGRMMKALGQRYVQYVNRTYRRTGTLWEGRFRSCPVQTSNYFLACQRYIELNPVRARMVEQPADYRWSSYARHAHGVADTLLTPHPTYLALGDSTESRQAAYRALFSEPLGQEMTDTIRTATNGNFVLGNDRFAAEVASALGRRASPGTPGRPPRRDSPPSGDLL